MEWEKCLSVLFTRNKQTTSIDLCVDNPDTLIRTKSTTYTIHGLRLALTLEQTWRLLEKSNLLFGETDIQNPYRIYVYLREADGTKGEAFLYLIWEPEENKMSRITVFEAFSSHLSERCSRLLSFEMVDATSDLSRSFLGKFSRCEITLDVPSIYLRNTTNFYDEIGLKLSVNTAWDVTELHLHLCGPEKVRTS